MLNSADSAAQEGILPDEIVYHTGQQWQSSYRRKEKA